MEVLGGGKKKNPRGRGGLFLGVGDDSGNDDRVVVNLKVKAPVLVDAGLPEVLAFVVLFSVQGRVLQIVSQKTHLFVESFADVLL